MIFYCNCVIIISSIKHLNEIPRRLRIIKATNIYKFFPAKKIAETGDFPVIRFNRTIRKRIELYNKYLKDKPYVITSFVPKGQLDMAAQNSIIATVVEEEIKPNEEGDQVEVAEEEIIKTPSNFDRSIQPETGASPSLHIPKQWNESLRNGMANVGS